MNQHQRGFSLVEVAITLAILGIIASISLPILNKYLLHNKIVATKERMEHITYVLAGYVLAHGTLPCPSSEEKNGIALSACPEISNAHGFLPYRTLGLDEKMAKDAFGKPFIYVVEPTLRLREVSITDYQTEFCYASDVPRVINLRANDREIKPTKSDFISFVLISSGAIVDTPNDNELSNLLKNGDIYSRAFVESGVNQFRQIIKWETRNNLVAAYGKSPCKLQEIPPPSAHEIKEKAAAESDNVYFPKQKIQES